MTENLDEETFLVSVIDGVYEVASSFLDVIFQMKYCLNLLQTEFVDVDKKLCLISKLNQNAILLIETRSHAVSNLHNWFETLGRFSENKTSSVKKSVLEIMQDFLEGIRSTLVAIHGLSLLLNNPSLDHIDVNFVLQSFDSRLNSLKTICENLQILINPAF